MKTTRILSSAVLALAISCMMLLAPCTVLTAGADDDFTIKCKEGTEGCYSVEENDGETTVTFSGMDENSVYSVSGTLKGNIVIDAGDYEFELNLNGVTIESSNNAPIVVTGGEEVKISAQKGTVNTVTDGRAAVGDDEEYSSAIYCECDLKIQGKGTLNVTSENNNGIKTKDDLKVKNLTLNVTCADNALKGNDSVTIESGKIVLIATDGDGIKTSNSDVSSKGNQRGTIAINSDEGDTSVTIYAANDGLDAAYDVTIDETEGYTVSLSVFTAKYSEYTSQDALNAIDAAKVQQTTTIPGMGQRGGISGGMVEGNADKSDVSTKGIKADNIIAISGGTISVKSYDDAIHANSDNELENGETALGNVTISGGELSLYTNDDAIHADGTLSVTDGTIRIANSFEGLEGTYVSISGGNVSVTSSDDGINATATTGTAISISGGYVYVYAGGDGLDSNSRTSRTGLVISGGIVVVISTGRGNSSLDTEGGYTVSDAFVLAICPSNAMISEVNNAMGTKVTSTLSLSGYVTVTASGENLCTVKMPISMSSYVVFFGNPSATITSVTVSDATLDADGVYFDTDATPSSTTGGDQGGTGTGGGSWGGGGSSGSGGSSGGTSDSSSKSSSGTSSNTSKSTSTNTSGSTSNGSSEDGSSDVPITAIAAVAAAGVIGLLALALVFRRH